MKKIKIFALTGFLFLTVGCSDAVVQNGKIYPQPQVSTITGVTNNQIPAAAYGYLSATFNFASPIPADYLAAAGLWMRMNTTGGGGFMCSLGAADGAANSITEVARLQNSVFDNCVGTSPYTAIAGHLYAAIMRTQTLGACIDTGDGANGAVNGRAFVDLGLMSDFLGDQQLGCEIVSSGGHDQVRLYFNNVLKLTYVIGVDTFDSTDSAGSAPAASGLFGLGGAQQDAFDNPIAFLGISNFKYSATKP